MKPEYVEEIVTRMKASIDRHPAIEPSHKLAVKFGVETAIRTLDDAGFLHIPGKT